MLFLRLSIELEDPSESSKLRTSIWECRVVNAGVTG